MTTLPHDQEHIPTLIAIAKPEDPFKNNIDVITAPTPEYPKFSLGFHHFIHQSKGKLVELEQFKGKKKVYLVFNKFERYIDDTDEDLDHMTTKYLPDTEFLN